MKKLFKMKKIGHSRYVFLTGFLGLTFAALAVLFSALFFSQSVKADVTTGLVSRWTLDETSGTSAADSVGSVTGALTNGPTWTSGRVGGAVSLDGVDDYVLLNNSVIGASDLTVCSWFYAKTGPSNRMNDMIDNTKFFIEVDTFNSPTYNLYSANNGNNGVASGGFTANAWHHQCTTRTGSNINFYIDGTLSGNPDQNAGAPTASNFPAAIGQYSSIHANNFFGNIDDVRIYNRALTAGEVSQIYQGDVSNPLNDTIAPVFSSVSSSVSPTSATITWTTDEVADSQVEYGTTASYGTLTTVDSTLTKNHSVPISNLSSQTTYHYRVRSKDSAGNQGIDTIDRTFTTGAPAGTTNDAASCSYTDVKNAIAAAADEGVVRVPPGTCVWTQQMIVDLQHPPKSLTIQSRDGCTLDAKGRPTSCTTTITDGIAIGDWPGTMFKISTSLGKSFRLSGFGFLTDPGVTSKIGSAIINIEGNTTAFRIDHNLFNIEVSSGRPIFPTGALTGVIDHNRFGVNVGQGVAMFGEGLGNESWATPASFGTANAIYIEDNEFKNLLVTDGWRGARFVIRYNDIETAVIPAQNHGAESGSGVRSGFSMEVYNNNVKLHDGDRLFFLRGGTALFHNNVITGPNVTLLGNFLSYRNSENVPPFAACDGAGPYDLNDNIVYDSGSFTGSVVTETQQIPATLTTNKNWTTNQWVGYSLRNITKGWGSEIISNTANTIVPVISPVSGYGFPNVIAHKWDPGDQFQILRANSCVDQVGRGAGNLLTGTFPNLTPTGWINQTIEPVYAWNNTINGAVNNSMSPNSYVIKKNRDYFEGVCRPGYTPYTYPHPLTGAAPQVQNLNCPAGGTPQTYTITATAGAGGTISPPGNTSITSGNGQTFTVTPSTGYQVNQVLVDGVAATLVSGTYSFANITTNHTISVTFVTTGPADTTAPTVSITSPVNSATVSGTVSLSASASDNVGGSGMAGVQFQVDGQNLGVEVVNPPYSGNWITTGASNGAHVIKAIARDAAGNIATSTPVTVTVANTVVQLTSDITSPAVPTGLAATAANSTQINLTWNASVDPTVSGAVTSGTAGYRIYRNNVLVTTVTGTSYSDTGLAEQTTYQYKIAAIDAATPPNASTQTSIVSASTPASPPPPVPAVLSAGSPTSALAAGTVRATLSLSTDKAAVCKYSTTANTAYASMTGTFTTTGGTTHSTSISNLTDGSTYTYYIRCAAQQTLINTGDYIVSFSVSSPAVITTTTGSGGNTGGGGTTSSGGTTSGIGSFTPLVQQPNASSTPANGAACTPSTIPSTLAPLPAGTTNFTIGTRSVAVTTLQTFLVSKGYLTRDSITGYYGPLTNAAVTKYKAALLPRTVECPTTATGATGTSRLVKGYQFTATLIPFATNAQVKSMQIFLNDHGYTVATTGSGSKGNETAYFGNATKAALIKFQKANNISPAIGNWGPLTRAKVNSMLK